MTADLIIKNLHASVEGQEILTGLDLEINKGEVHAIMGPNGSGKSTLANTLMGHPAYHVTEGEVWFKGQDILKLTADARSRLGIFLAFQYPSTIPGVSVSNFLRTALNARYQQPGQASSGNGQGESKGLSMRDFRDAQESLAMLKIDPGFACRYQRRLQVAARKRVEILQMAMLQPEIAILDDNRIRLDIDALRTSPKVNAKSPNSILVITHYQRILNYIARPRSHPAQRPHRHVQGLSSPRARGKRLRLDRKVQQAAPGLVTAA